jgi:hypothetical protein
MVVAVRGLCAGVAVHNSDLGGEDAHAAVTCISSCTGDPGSDLPVGLSRGHTQ